MANEAWLNGKLDGYAPEVMPAAHALAQAITDLETHAIALSDEEVMTRLNDSPSAAFHLRHIAGSINRLLTYARGEELSETQFEFLKRETAAEFDLNAVELTGNAIDEINNALDALQNVAPERLFEERFVGRKRLPTNVFGLLFHIAEHTMRHVGQVITIARIVRKEKTNR